MAKALLKFHYGALVLFLAALFLWLIDPSPLMYLLTFSLLGILWFAVVIWMWRMWNIVATIVAMFAFALYQVPQRFFELPSQVLEFQGVLLALSIVAILLYLFRDGVVRYGRLRENPEGAAPDGGPGEPVDNSSVTGGHDRGADRSP